MNDRIRELIVSLEPDAFMTYKGYLYHSNDPKVLEHSNPEPLYTQQELVKFAELIVKQCAGVAEVSMSISSHPDDRLTVKNSVLKHFGVEE
jgi:hypothetical protein